MMTMSTTSSSNEEEQRLKAVWASIGVPVRLADATLDSYKPGCAEQKQAWQKCRSFAAEGLNNIAAGKGLFLQGPVGTGKSHLSIATLRAIVEAHPNRFGRPQSLAGFVDEPVYPGYYCSMVSVVDLLDRLREAYRRDRRRAYTRELEYRCRNDAVLILDDIGAEKPTEWVEEQMYALIDVRYRMQRSTFFTTNCTPKELESQIGIRCVSRICEMCEGIKVEGKDWRKRDRSNN